MNKREFEVSIERDSLCSVVMDKEKKYYVTQEGITLNSKLNFLGNTFGCYEENGEYFVYFTDCDGNMILKESHKEECAAYKYLYDTLVKYSMARKQECVDYMNGILADLKKSVDSVGATTLKGYIVAMRLLLLTNMRCQLVDKAVK